MATTGIGFRWLDLLEKEFDKACVELETSLVELEAEEPEVVFSARRKISTLSSSFAQLTHKALTIFQHSAKLEAELVDMRADLVQTRAAGGCQDAGDTAGNVTDAARARAEAAQLARENAALRQTVLALHSELFGARLATKYLDKELAGRIQQLQLLARDMRAEIRDSLWAQVEAEILLQRHKTLVRVCRGVSPRPARPAPAGRARPRTVRVRRSPHLGLGISVTGGREHGVPILISELEAGGPAALTGELYVGDAILAINDCDLTQACHKEAVQALQSVKGDCALCVQFIATDDDDRLSEDNYRFPLYPEDGEEADGSGATPTAPRTPDFNHRATPSDSESRADVYADYSAINNNLTILDMDDDSIKIEARLEMAPAGDAVAVPPSPYSSSPHSTPVHAARNTLKKKRKPQDWRTKGTYSAVSPDAHSSDDPPDANIPLDNMYPPVKPESLLIKPIPEVQAESPATTATTTSPPTTTPPGPLHEPALTPTNPREPPAPPAQEAQLQLLKVNGDARIRKETKGFRIGTARRVTDALALRNGDDRPRAAPRLLPGRGDPDFGTPV